MRARLAVATVIVLLGGITVFVVGHRIRIEHSPRNRGLAATKSGRDSGRLSGGSDTAATPGDTAPARSVPPGPAAASAPVGPLFQPAADVHGCTASVVDSPSRDLLITAAHCVTGTAAGLRFTPGYSRGIAPYGSWTVLAAYADPHWVQGQDQRYDFAVLRVAADQSGRHIQDRVGANRLPSGPRTVPAVVHVVGYAAGRDDDAVTCNTTATDYEGDETSPFLEFDCAGFVSGTSGSPWITAVDPVSGAGAIVGLIGGLDAGGCSDAVSYSPRLGAAAVALVGRAESGDAPDQMPSAPSDGC